MCTAVTAVIRSRRCEAHEYGGQRAHARVAPQTFYFRSQLLAGELTADGGHAWLTRDELRGALAPAEYTVVEPVLSA